ncbi:MAG TPA: acyl-CoA reductase [Polyangiaceae bacterium]|nr:acyl-CoA reductase [Polyangiaceae bacterium]
MADTAERRARLERLLEAARELANPEKSPGQALRARLLETTGLSGPGIERGITHSLEAAPSEAELQALLASTPHAPRAHVLLSSNVFVGALRAIAIGVASSAQVCVRASRRDPALAEALHALVPELFQLVSALTPGAGEHLWSYGSDTTLADLRASLPPGVWFHPHGSGFGAVIVDAASWTPEGARPIALDTALFDQQGCLSPRVVVLVGSAEQARIVAQALATALQELEIELPPGTKSQAELAEARRDRDTAAYAFELFEAGSGWVSCASELVVPPSFRSLHVVDARDAVATLRPFQAHLTCVSANTQALRDQLQQAFSGSRVMALGEMQRPPLDGPVDRRHGTQGELVG